MLYGGAAVYLIGRFLFLRLTVRTSPSQFVAIGVTLLLVPVAGVLPALAALGLLTVFLTILVLYERFTAPVQ
ncbi:MULTISPECIES: hypothetical protein [unclassified Micromonospora]|uniref:hypothetical protein n=1 Tax=Micromonospora sp. NPDC005087 TaxID=3364225 RepID=UPI0036875581